MVNGWTYIPPGCCEGCRVDKARMARQINAAITKLKVAFTVQDKCSTMPSECGNNPT